MRRFIKDLWTVAVERAKLRKALRLLSKQEWSVDFLIYLLNKAAKVQHQQVGIIVRNGENEIVLTSGMDTQTNYAQKEQEFDYSQEQSMLTAMTESML